MATSLRFGSALSVIALATMVGGCSAFSGKSGRVAAASDVKVAPATRAQFALAAKDYATAVSYAEQAAERTPADANIRTLLGNAYFGAGRFASAEGAYRDSLSLNGGQPQVVLKLALVQIAQGRNAEALATLNVARNAIDASDYGLALALAGRGDQAVAVLQERARHPEADAQVRQNLALALALTGDWTNARIIASQDLPADLVDARIQQWMAFAQPSAPSSQIAGLLGVTPAAADPGQPVQLALNKAAPTQALAEAQPVEVAPVQVAESVPVQAPIETINVPPAAPAAFAEASAPAYVATPAAPAPAFAEPVAAPVKLKPLRASAKVGNKIPLRHAAFPRPSGNSAAVVQIGAFGSPERVGAAWDKAAKRFTALRAYTPMSAKFASGQGTVYRLSVKGFASAREAQGLCSALKAAGQSCFVRSVAGDTPVQYASR
jgi:Flp pilus assembly protein TadD